MENSTLHLEEKIKELERKIDLLFLLLSPNVDADKLQNIDYREFAHTIVENGDYEYRVWKAEAT